MTKPQASQITSFQTQSEYAMGSPSLVTQEATDSKPVKTTCIPLGQDKQKANKAHIDTHMQHASTHIWKQVRVHEQPKANNICKISQGMQLTTSNLQPGFFWTI